MPVGKLAGCVAVGIWLGAMIFIPNIIAVAKSSRMQVEKVVELFFSPNYYLYMPINFLGMGERVNWTIVGYVLLIAIAIFMLFSYRRKYTQLKIGFILLTVMLCIPYVAHVMSGFSNVANRWIFGYGFLLSFIVVKMLPAITVIDSKRVKSLLVIAAIYLSYVCWVLFDAKTPASTRKTAQLAGSQYLIVLVAVILIFVWSNIAKKNEDKAKAQFRNVVIKCILLMTVLINIFFQANWLFSVQGDDYISEFLAPGQAYTRQTKIASLIDSINDKGEFYRFSENARDKGQLDNNALVSQLHGHSLYYSLFDGNYLEYLSELQCNDIDDFRRVNGLDSRTALNAMGTTKYYVTELSMEEGTVPYGYQKLFDNNGYGVYENEYFLPLGYTY